ncbi:unnamed protein product [Camellia sinensis]
MDWEIINDLRIDMARLASEKLLRTAEKMVLVACGWRHTISVLSSGGLYTYGWSKYGQLGHGDFEDHLIPHRLEALQKQFRSHVGGGIHLLLLKEKMYFLGEEVQMDSLGMGSQLTANIPKMIESLSADGSSGQQIEFSKLDPSTGKALVSPIERYAVVPDDN